MWRRWTCCLGAVLLISACSHGTLTRVVRTDGTTVVGELTAARPDAVVIKLADGSSITIPRAIIKSVESAATPPAAAPTTPAAPAVAANNAGKSGNQPTASKSVTTPPAATVPNPPANSGSTPGVATTNRPPSTTTPANPTNTGNTGSTTPKPMRETVAPSGTTLELSLSAAVGSDSSNVDDKIDAVLRAPVIINGESILEAGAVARGIVTEATPSEKAEGRGRLTLRFDTIQLGSRTVSIQTTPMHWEAPGIAKKPAPEPRGGKRSVFGKLVDKTKKGLHIGDDDNAPRGSAEVRLAAGAVLRVRLEQPTRIAP